MLLTRIVRKLYLIYRFLHLHFLPVLLWTQSFVPPPAAVTPLCSCRLVEKYGEGQWSLISTFFPGRIGKQCRERWHHQLNPKINRNAWSVEEERIIVAAHKVHVCNKSQTCHGLVPLFVVFLSRPLLFACSRWPSLCFSQLHRTHRLLSHHCFFCMSCTSLIHLSIYVCFSLSAASSMCARQLTLLPPVSPD